MFRGKETGNKLTRRISAAVLALVLIITSVNVDWNTLNATAEPNPTEYITIENGGFIAQKVSFGGATGQYLKRAAIQVSSVDEVAVTATIAGLYRGSVYTPDDGVPITTDNAFPTASPVTVSWDNPSWIEFWFTPEDAINFIYEETVTVVMQISWDSVAYPDVDTVRITQNTTMGNGFYTYAGSWNGTYGLMDCNPDPANSIPAKDVSIASDFYLAPGQSIDIMPGLESGFIRHFNYTRPENDYEIISLANDTSTNFETVTAVGVGTSTITISGYGVTPAATNIHVVDVSHDIDSDLLVFNNSVQAPQKIKANLGTSTVNAESNMDIVGDPYSIDVGRYMASVSGKGGAGNYPGYSIIIPYEIVAKDISPVIAVGLDGYASNLSLDIDHSTGNILSGSFRWQGSGATEREFYLGSDFNAQIIGDADKTTIGIQNPIYEVLIEGKKNFTGSVTVKYKDTLSASEININDVYNVSVDRPEITYDKDHPVVPSFTFTKKTPETQIINGIPGDVVIKYYAKDTDYVNNPTQTHDLQSAGPVKVVITSTLYSGEIVKEFIIKRNIALEDNFAINLKNEDKVTVAKYNSSGGIIPFTPIPESVILDTTELSQTILGLGNDYDISYSHNDTVGTATLTVTGIGYYTGSKSTTFRILPNIDVTAEISIGSALPLATKDNGFESGYVATYTGSTITVNPSQVAIWVDDNGDGVKEILSDKYYTISSPSSVPETYPDRNLNAGRKNGCIEITTTPAYGSQTLTVYFEIAPCSLKDVTIIVEDSEKFNNATTYTGNEINLNPETDGFRFEVKGANNLSVSSDEFSITGYSDDHTNAGEARVSVTGSGNYFGVASTSFNILKRSINDPGVEVTPIAPQTYSKIGKRPDVYITYNGKNLVKDTDFAVVNYFNNTDITTSSSKASVLIRGNGNFSGDRTEYFEIAPADIANGDIKFQLTDKNGTVVSVTIADGVINQDGAVEIKSAFKSEYDGGSVIPSLAVIGPDGVPLNLGTDYYLVTNNTINAASAEDEKAPSLKIYGKGSYSSSSMPVIIKYNISKRPIYDNDRNNSVSYINLSTDLDGNIIVFKDSGNKDHKNLRRGLDYEVETDPADDGMKKGVFKGVITGIGNYTGRLEYEYIRGNSLAGFYVDIFNPTYFDNASSRINAKELNNGKPYYHEVSYIGKNKPLIVVRDPNYKEDGSDVLVNQGTDTTQYKALSSTYYDIEYTVIPNENNVIIDSEGYLSGSYVEVTITGKNDYFGVIKRYYSIINNNFGNLNNTTSGPVGFDYDITLNGKECTGEEALANSPENYKYEFTYTGENKVTPVISVVYNPKYRVDRTKYPYIPAVYDMVGTDVPVKTNGTLNLAREDSQPDSITIIPLPGYGFNTDITSDDQNKSLVYIVNKTTISAGTGGNVVVTGIDGTYPYKWEAYTKADFTPIVRLIQENVVLSPDKDYDFEIKAEVGADTENVTYTSGASPAVTSGAYIEIKGKGFYTGTIKVPITITPLSLKDSEVVVELDENADIGGANPNIKVSYGNKILTMAPTVSDTGDYYVTGFNQTVVGKKNITIIGKGNYKDSLNRSYYVKKNIGPDPDTNDLRINVSGLDNNKPYYEVGDNLEYVMYSDGRIVGKTDSTKTLSLNTRGSIDVELVTAGPDGETDLTYGTDYTIELKKMSKPSTSEGMKIVITGVGNYYGVQEIPVKKLWGRFSAVNVFTEYSHEGQVQYTGSIVPHPEVSFTHGGETFVLSGSTEYEVKYLKQKSDNSFPIEGSGGDTDYNNYLTNSVRDIGTYKLIVTGKGIYEGSRVEREFTIVPRPMNVTMTLDKTRFEYTGNTITPKLTVKDGSKTLQENTDFTVSGNKSATVPGKYTITITGMGNYDDTQGQSIDYEIFGNLENADEFNIASTVKGILITKAGAINEADPDGANDSLINKGSLAASSSIVVEDKNPSGVTLTRLNDYEVSVEGAAKPGDRATIVVTGKGYYTGTKRFANVPVYGLISETDWTNKQDAYTFTGGTVSPVDDMNLSFRTRPIVKDVAYSAETVGAPTRDVGEYAINLTGLKDGGFLGTSELKYNILYDLSQATVTLSQYSFPYDGNPKEPAVTVMVPGNNNPLIQAATGVINPDYAVAYSADHTSAGTASVTINMETGRSFGSKTVTYEITKRVLTDSDWSIDFNTGNSYSYTGEAITPEVTATFDSSITPVPTYEVTYSANNINVTKTAKAIVNLTGNYQGKKELTFEITPRSIVSTNVIVDPISVVYTGKVVKPALTVTDGQKTLVEGYDYTVIAESKDVGTGQVRIIGKNNYTGEKAATFNIEKIDISEAGSISITVPSREYNGKEVSPEIIKESMTVTVIAGDGSRLLLPKEGYKVSFDSGVAPMDVGEYSVYVEPNGMTDYVVNIAEAKFEITKKVLSNELLDTVYHPSVPTEIGADGRRYIQQNALYNKDFNISEDLPVTVDEQYIRLTDSVIGKELIKGVSVPQVRYEYANNDLAGIATFTFMPADNSNYTGEIVLYFRIGYDLSSPGTIIEMSPSEFEYDGEGHVPAVNTVTYGGIPLTEGVDYIVLPGDGDPKAVNVGTHRVTVRGKGKRYYGDATQNFTIKKRSKEALYADFADGALIDGTWIYNGIPATPEIVVYDSSLDNKVVDPNEYTVRYLNNTSVGTASYTVTMKDRSNYESGAISYAGGSNNFQIVASQLTDGELEIRLSGTNPYSFTGRRITPKVSVYYNGTVVPSSNYTVYYNNNILPGTAQVSVVLRGNYEGGASATFDIVANLSSQAVAVNAADRRWTGEQISSEGIKAYLLSNPVIDLVEGQDYVVTVSPAYGDWSTALRAKAELVGNSPNVIGSKTVYFNLIKNMNPGQDPDDPGYVDPPKPDGPDDPDDPENPDNPDNPDNPVNPTGKINLGDESKINAYIAPTVFNYDGKAHRPIVYVVDKTKNYTLQVSTNNGVTGDYTVSYSNMYGPGTATLTINGINNYTGSKSFDYTIQQQTIVIRGLMAVPVSTSSIRLDWVGMNDVNGYNITWTGSDGTTGNTSVTGTASTVTVTGLNPATTYNFRVNAHNNVSQGNATTIATTLSSGSGGTGGGTGGGGSSSVTVPSVTGVSGNSASPGSANIYWTNAGDGTMYDIYRSTSSSSIGNLAATITRNQGIFVDMGVNSGVTYYYVIQPFKLVNNQKVYGSYGPRISVTVR